MKDNIRTCKYTWRKFDTDVIMLSQQIIPYIDLIKTIYSVPRGGLVLGVRLSYLLGKELILEKNRINEFTLVVDDISDTGNTLFKLLKDRKSFGTATLFCTTTSKFKPIFCCTKVDKRWIVFPWETLSSSKIDDT